MLEPAGDPARAIQQGLFVDRCSATNRRIAAELQLSPSSSHLLIGGVGSGKTTELHAAGMVLDQVSDTRALFVDVSRDHDIARMVPGAITILAGLRLADALELELATRQVALPESLAQALARLRSRAHGFWDDYEYFPDDDGGQYIAGLLSPPEPVDDDVRLALETIEQLRTVMFERHLVVLLDGLDRMTDIDAFAQCVDADVQALTTSGIGVVLVGPLRALYGMDRAVTERFDRLHYQPWHDVQQAPSAGPLLAEVLQKRVADALDEQAVACLVQHSGGVVRDLLGLAQGACVEAYMDGVEVIGLHQVERAIDGFGRKHMQGLRGEEIEVLHRVLTTGAFVHTSEDALALLMTRRVLEYRSATGIPRHVVHPTIARFLDAMAAGST